MKRQPVKSSSLASVGYDPATKTMEVEFKHGGVYHYSGVSPQRYKAFSEAESLGQYLHAKIKPTYKVIKIS